MGARDRRAHLRDPRLVSDAPVELEHALRHLQAATTEWANGKMELAAMHLREAICDASWSLYQAWARTAT